VERVQSYLRRNLMAHKHKSNNKEGPAATRLLLSPLEDPQEKPALTEAGVHIGQ
jgi:hypothetical protein